MKTAIPFTKAMLNSAINNAGTAHVDDMMSALKHARDVIGCVEALLAKTSEDGLTDPVAVVEFLDRLYALNRGKPRSTLRTTIPVEEWDRRCENFFAKSLPDGARIPSSLNGETYVRSSSWVTATHV